MGMNSDSPPPPPFGVPAAFAAGMPPTSGQGPMAMASPVAHAPATILPPGAPSQVPATRAAPPPLADFFERR